MNEDRLYIDSDIIDDYNARLDKNSSGLSNVLQNSMTNFTTLKSNKIYNKGFKKIENALEKSKGTIDNFVYFNRNYTKEFFNFEEIMSQKINGEINVPKNFKINGIFGESIVKNVNLNKNDGLSVNNGVETREISSENASSVIKENLEDIDKRRDQTEKEIGTQTIINREKLGDINNNIEQEEQKLSTITDINREDLNNMQNINIINASSIAGTMSNNNYSEEFKRKEEDDSEEVSENGIES